MAALKAGDSFSSFGDLEACISVLEKETNSKFFKSSSVTLRSFLQSSPGHYISKTISNRDDKDAFIEEKKYRLIKLACTHGGRKYAGKADRVRSTKTKKLDCPVLITVILDKSLKLVVKELNLEHSHTVSKASFMLEPENRRLTEDEKEVARQFHRVGADKKRIRQHMLDQYGKVLTRHDLNNVLRVPKNGQPDLEAAISILSERGFASTVVEDAGTVCGLFFQDQEMRSAYEKFPDLLLMDSTYKLLDIRTPVFTILTVDSFGRGVPLAVFLVTNETAHMIGAMLRVFREHNTAAASITKVWLTDKDRAEKAAIKDVFPDCDQFLCSFHVLQSFRRELNLASVEKGERERILGVLQQLVFASSETEYRRLREDIRHPATDRYLKDNWDEIRGEWVRGLSGAAMSGVFTNNHLESLHGKMKSVCRTNDTLPNFIQSYLTVLTTVRADRNAEIHAEVNKRPTSCRFAELDQYQRHVTSFALSLLQDELVESATVTLVDSPGGLTACDRAGRVAVSSTACDCLFYRHYSLPCRHIMAVRLEQGMCLFSQELVGQKWLLSFAADHLEAQLDCRVPFAPSVSTRSLPPGKPPRTERERYRQLLNVTSQIASVGCELTGAEHRQLLDKLTSMLHFLQQRRSFLIVEEVDGVPTNDSDLPMTDAPPSDVADADLTDIHSPTGGQSQPTGRALLTATSRSRPAEDERPNFDIFAGFFDSPLRLGAAPPAEIPSPDQVSCSSRPTAQGYKPAVPSPLTKTRTPDYSGRMTPRRVVVSPSWAGSPAETPNRGIFTGVMSPSVVAPRAGSHGATKPLAARRNLVFPCGPSDAPSGSGLVHRSQSQSPSQCDDAGRAEVSLSPIIGIGPSPIVGVPPVRTVTVPPSVAGPSTSRISTHDARNVQLHTLTMPPRVAKNRGRPKGSKTTVIGALRK
ncbi:protein FAR1-RELATED SEQUENCE 2-like isoform X1 [Amphibalanus amphitrite]|uniref:protein FAR1-RELATED SEQUENCE 2-like isoform X1 n=2 Tax=Amphibalanus amphitrite TaxID=1232801 RepID=UPI001C903178|nr:protein FAR1-RELATED SEQUENCE 2-like isoform X1 [Amphibalanus amphitrite]XP_043209957.1 protein FAR1-RELATED SEQUENCE 2-like isoform X1 [Amphibalanus amphitrite]